MIGCAAGIGWKWSRGEENGWNLWYEEILGCFYHLKILLSLPRLLGTVWWTVTSLWKSQTSEWQGEPVMSPNSFSFYHAGIWEVEEEDQETTRPCLRKRETELIKNKLARKLKRSADYGHSMSFVGLADGRPCRQRWPIKVFQACNTVCLYVCANAFPTDTFLMTSMSVQ